MKTFIELVLEKYSNLKEAYRTEEEFHQHILSGEVTMPIKDAIELMESMQPRSLPSGFQLGQACSINHPDFFVRKASVIRVHFTESKVMYDLEVEIVTPSELANSMHTRIYNIDSAFLNPIEG